VANLPIILGDLLTIAILTILGFFSHGEVGIAYVPRMGTTFFPVAVAWFFISPWLGSFDSNVIKNSKLIWRIPLSMLFAAPFAAILRAALLGTTASPLFTLVIGLTNAIGMTVWRALYLYYLTRRNN